jgi:hypothetical protein
VSHIYLFSKFIILLFDLFVAMHCVTLCHMYMLPEQHAATTCVMVVTIEITGSLETFLLSGQLQKTHMYIARKCFIHENVEFS